MFGGDDVDTLFASEYGDTLFGDAGSDKLSGGVSGDFLLGDEGAVYYRVPAGLGGAFDIVLASQGAEPDAVVPLTAAS